MHSASLIVTTYNWTQALALCLQSIARQRVRPLDVVVADDGSREDTARMIAAMASDFPVSLRHAWQEDLGFRAARARNLGINASRGDYVIFVDGDMVLHRSFVADHLAIARAGSYLQGGRLNASQEESARLLAGGAVRFAPTMPFAPFVKGELKPRHAVRVPWVAGMKARKPSRGIAMSCNLGVWRRDLQRVNGFDERYEGWGREDDDLVTRLRHAGIERRLLRYAGMAVHLWHPMRWPDGVIPNGAIPNDRLLQETVATRAIRCDAGLDAHAPLATATA